VIKNLITY